MTIGYGMVGVAGIVACLYMAEHGYEWWQIALMAFFATCFVAPAYKVTYRKED
jgi:hypothetical protein